MAQANADLSPNAAVCVSDPKDTENKQSTENLYAPSESERSTTPRSNRSGILNAVDGVRRKG